MEMQTLTSREFFEEIADEALEDLFSPVARAAEKVRGRMDEKLGRIQGRPSRPGEPPAEQVGALRDAVGRTGPFVDRGAEGTVVAAAVGIGVGDEATRRVAKWKGRGVNVFEYAPLLERGGFAGGNRIAARPYVRATVEELRAEILADWQRELS
jgi:ElaB/YqjD/DUF883 family membrane-anchored ribosome-binding protein